MDLNLKKSPKAVAFIRENLTHNVQVNPQGEIQLVTRITEYRLLKLDDNKVELIAYNVDNEWEQLTTRTKLRGETLDDVMYELLLAGGYIKN